jgi:formylglycine-generating enzyme required for sulfatase activity
MSEIKTRPLRVFLCHASQDKPIVRDLYSRLKAEDWIDPWLDEEKLFPGQDWNLEIEKAVEAADAILVCLSNESVTKEGYIQRELRYVLDIAEYKPEGTLYIIPVRLEVCKPPRRLRIWQYADYFPAEQRESAYQRLLVSLQTRAHRLGILPTDQDEKPFNIQIREKNKKVERQEEKPARGPGEKEVAESREGKGFDEKSPQQNLLEKKSERRNNLLLFSLGGMMILALAFLIFNGTNIYWNMLALVEPSSTKVVPSVVPTYITALTQTPSTVAVDSDEFGIGNTMVSESDGMALLYIPTGKFTMGSENGQDDEKPAHTVYLDAFWMDQTEVTNEMYTAFLNEEDNQREGDALWLDENEDDVHIHKIGETWTVDPGYEDHPVTEVTWYGARAYCTWTGRRLPTEAEWEKAARGGLEGKSYPWGDEVPSCKKGTKNGATFANNEDCNFGEPTQIKNYTPNGYELYDMAGNVWEWVADWYGVYQEAPDSNPSGAETGKFRVVRGGAWDYSSSYLRSAFRGRDSPKTTAPDVGFRCVRDVSP